MSDKVISKQLSILLPVYNHTCVSLVKELRKQAEDAGIDYEIIAADDGSTNPSHITANNVINDLPRCKYIIRKSNIGRAAIRNFLAKQAKFPLLLFLDCDVELPDNCFIARYIQTMHSDVTDGGVSVGIERSIYPDNLRFIYEQASEPHHTAKARTANPYKSFRTTNFMVSRSIMLSMPFDERFIHYGYEDVLFGKQLKENGINITHIDNPVIISDMEPNDIFIAKTEEALHTLYRFKSELQGFSALLSTANSMQQTILPAMILRLWHKAFGNIERNNLTGSRPSLKIFDIYRLGYYLSITNKNLKQ